jgi:hypothetical protein
MVRYGVLEHEIRIVCVVEAVLLNQAAVGSVTAKDLDGHKSRYCPGCDGDAAVVARCRGTLQADEGLFEPQKT